MPGPGHHTFARAPGRVTPSIERYNAPLEQATTVSLDALNAYGLALSTWDKKGDRESLPIFHEASNWIQTSPWRMADRRLSITTWASPTWPVRMLPRPTNLDLGNRVRTGDDRCALLLLCNGELEKSAECTLSKFRIILSHPAPITIWPLTMANSDATKSQSKAFAKPCGLIRRELHLLKSRGHAAGFESGGRRVRSCDGSRQAAIADRFSDASGLSDSFPSRRQWGNAAFVQQSLDVPGGQSLLLSDQSNTEAYHGRYGKARESSRVAARLMEHNGDTESAANCLAQAAVREAEVGDSARASQFISEALKLSRGQDVRTLAALSMARMGRFKRAEALSQELDKEWPVGTYVRNTGCP